MNNGSLATTDTALSVPENSELTDYEVEELGKLEKNIERGIKSFIEVGIALTTIRDRRLYRGQYQTFEEYCRGRWDMVASRARQLIAAAETTRALESVTVVTPANERQVRPLISLPPDQQREAWAKANEMVPEGETPTGRDVERAVRELRAEETTTKTQNGSTYGTYSQSLQSLVAKGREMEKAYKDPSAALDEFKYMIRRHRPEAAAKRINKLSDPTIRRAQQTIITIREWLTEVEELLQPKT